MLIDNQRNSYQGVQNSIAWVKFNMDEIMKKHDDLDVMSSQIKETDLYLHKILPINLET